MIRLPNATTWPDVPELEDDPVPRTEARSKYGNQSPYEVFGKKYYVMANPTGYSEAGRASWYGTKFQGRPTSSGEPYDMYAMTAAHKTLPLGTLVRVRHLQNQRSIEVRINDRGPFVGDRIIDLSYEAARRLGVIGPGTAAVEVQAIGTLAGTPADVYSGNFTFQVGAFASRENAERLRAELNPRFGNAHIVEFEQSGRVFYRLRVGKCTSLDEAIAYEAHLKENGFKDAFAVAE